MLKSSGDIPSGSRHSNPCTKFATIAATSLRPRLYAGQIRRPDPNGSSSKWSATIRSRPTTQSSSSAAADMASGCRRSSAIAHSDVIAVVSVPPAITSWIIAFTPSLVSLASSASSSSPPPSSARSSSTSTRSLAASSSPPANSPRFRRSLSLSSSHSSHGNQSPTLLTALVTANASSRVLLHLHSTTAGAGDEEDGARHGAHLLDTDELERRDAVRGEELGGAELARHAPVGAVGLGKETGEAIEEAIEERFGT
nr:unnamed protein product [Digitaria exilis]